MIQILARSSIWLMLLGPFIVLSASALADNDAVRPVPQNYIARCRNIKAEEAQLRKPIPGEGEIRAGCPPGQKCKFEPEPQWSVDLHPFETLTIDDDEGHHDSIAPTNDIVVAPLLLSVHQTNELVFTTGKWELNLTLLKGVNSACPDEAIRYTGQLVPEGSRLRLRITPQGVGDLHYDHNGDGNFSSTMRPTSHVFAPKAWDTEGPRLKFSQRIQDADTLLIIISAEDESGVRRVMHSLPDSDIYHSGTTIKVDRAKPHLISAFAEDSLGNRAAGDYTTKPRR